MAETQRVVTELVVDATGTLRTMREVEAATGRVENALDRTEAAGDAAAASAQQAGQRMQEAMDRAAAAQKRATDAITGGTNMQDQSTRRLLATYGAAERAANPVMAVQQRIQRQIAATTELVDRRVLSEQRAAATIAALREKEIRDIARLQQANDNLAAAERSRASGAADNDNSSRFRRQNLSYQLFDIGQTAALGMNPAMIAMQQGPQIAQLYAGQGGVNAALKDMAGLAATAARSLGPIAVAAGIGAVAIADMRGEIEDATGVAVTFGDVTKAVFQVIGGYIMDAVQPAIDWIEPYWTKAWDGVQNVTAIAFNGVVSAVLTAIETIKYVAGALPSAFRQVGEAVANSFIIGINWMVEQSLTAINGVIKAINTITQAGESGIKLFEPDKYKIGAVDLGSDVDNLAGSFENFQKRLADISKADHLGAFQKDISDQSVDNFNQRLEEGEKSGKKAAKGYSEADKAAQELIRQYEGFSSKAEGLMEKMFPGEAAQREADELRKGLEAWGDSLDQFQRIAVQSRIADLDLAASMGLRDLPDETRRRGKEAGDALMDTLGQAIDSIFDSKSAEDFFDNIIRMGAQLGNQFRQMGVETLLGNIQSGRSPFAIGSGTSRTAANDNADPWQGMRGLSTSLETTSKSALSVARQFEGLNERADSKVLDTFLRASGNWKGLSAQDTAWCAAFANASIMSAGGQGTGSNMASSFLNWGMGTNNPKPGDIVVLKPQAAGTSGHVGFVAGFGDGKVQVFGGNQSGGANVQSYGTDQVVGYRTSLDRRDMTNAVSDGSVDASARIAVNQKGQQGGFFQNGGMGVLGAGAGAFFQGMQSGSTIGGGLSGVMSGIGAAPQISSALGVSGAAGGILGAVGGGILGIIGGLFGRSRQKRKERGQAKKALDEQMGAIEELLDYASGAVVGSISKAVREFKDETAKAIEVATKAGDRALVDKLKASVGQLQSRLVREFQETFSGSLDALNLGYGVDNPYEAGAQAVRDLGDQLLAFVDNARTAIGALEEMGQTSRTAASGMTAANSNNPFAGAKTSAPNALTTWANGMNLPEGQFTTHDIFDAVWRHKKGEIVPETLKMNLGAELPINSMPLGDSGIRDQYYNALKEAQAAAKAYLLAQEAANDSTEEAAAATMRLSDAQRAAVKSALASLSGADELTAIEEQIMTLRGKAAALPPVLQDIGLSAVEAADAVAGHLSIALAQLKDDYVDDLTRSINDLSGVGFMNDILDAQKLYEERLKDASAVGLDGSLAMRELNLSIADIAKSADLTDDQLRILAKTFPALASSLLGAIGGGAGTSVADAQAAVDRARTDLRAAYEKESAALEQTIERVKQFIDQIGDFRKSMLLNERISPLNPEQRLAEAAKQFREIAAKAASGDDNAQSDLTRISQAYLDEASSFYGSSLGYMKIWDEVDAVLKRTQGSAETQLSVAERQLDSLKTQVGKLIDIDNGVKTVAQAIAALSGAIGGLQSAMQNAVNGQGGASSESIARAYVDILGRAPDAAGQAYFEDKAAGGRTADQIRQDIANSNEAKTQAAYKDILGRTASASEIAYWQSTGKSASQIQADILYAKSKGSKAMGGYAGDMPVGQIAGVYHGQEFIAHAAATAKWRPQLEAMNAGTYREGGNGGGLTKADIGALAMVVEKGANQQVQALREELALVREELAASRREAGRTVPTMKTRAA